MFGLNWNKNKTVYLNLLEIKGISHTTANKLCALLGISTKTQLSKLAHHKLEQLNLVLSSFGKKNHPLTLNSLSDLFISLPVVGLQSKQAIDNSQGKIDSIKHTPIMGALDSWVKTSLTTLVEQNSYRGRRLKQGYPSKGQRTKTNAKTARKLNKGRVN